MYPGGLRRKSSSGRSARKIKNSDVEEVMAEIANSGSGVIGAAPASSTFAPETADGRAIGKNYRFMILLMLAATYGLNMADRGILNVVMPVLKKEFHFHDWQVGVLVGPVFAVVYSLCSIPFSTI